MLKVAILDYSIGNLYSIEKAFQKIGVTPYLIHTPEELSNAERLVLPGVGSFDQCMNALHEANLTQSIKNYILGSKPFLGICVGMQMLFSKSLEGNGVPGLGIFKGTVSKIEPSAAKIPHIGWEQLTDTKNCSILSNLHAEAAYYFIHSYAVMIEEERLGVSKAIYDSISIPAVVQRNKTIGCQFHPEKSRESGLRILRNFMEL